MASFKQLNRPPGVKSKQYYHVWSLDHWPAMIIENFLQDYPKLFPLRLGYKKFISVDNFKLGYLRKYGRHMFCIRHMRWNKNRYVMVLSGLKRKAMIGTECEVVIEGDEIVVHAESMNKGTAKKRKTGR